MMVILLFLCTRKRHASNDLEFGAADPMVKAKVTKQPIRAKNDGWGEFKNRETFVDMHIC